LKKLRNADGAWITVSSPDHEVVIALTSTVLGIG